MALLGNSLGTNYGTDWEIWEQTGNDSYEVNATHRNTEKRKLNATEGVELGKSYWIIIDAGAADANKTVTIPKNLGGLSPTDTADANSSGVNINDPDFTKVHGSILPNNTMSAPGNVKKYMAGNPFPFAFHLTNLYFSHNFGTGGSYNPMGNTANNAYINPTFYKHNSNLTGPVNGYTAVNAGTPGFDNGGINAMEGFFIKIEEDNSPDINAFAYPLMMNNRP
jgi:hypothetical protein